MKNPSKFHLNEVTFNSRNLLTTFQISFEVRDIMKMYRIMHKRGERIMCKKIEMFLNSYAESCKYDKFNINEEISTKQIGVNNDN